MTTPTSAKLTLVLLLSSTVSCEPVKMMAATNDTGLPMVEADAASAEMDAMFALESLNFPVEMYSWRSEREWCFTFVAVTSSTKPRWVVKPEPFTEGFKAWVCGFEGLKQLLNRFRKGQEIVWLDGTNLVGVDGPDTAYPDEADIRSIVGYARSIGLVFYVPLPGF